MTSTTSGELIPLGGEVTGTTWAPARELSYDEWAAAGGMLQRIGRAWQWWVGDWINYGERRYGEKYTQAIEATGLEVEALKNAAWVANAIEPSTRVDVLSWTHHREVAALDPDEQAQWLTEAACQGWTSRELRTAVRRRQLTQGEAPALPDGTFRCLVIDPPWPMPKIEREVRPNQGPILDYPTMNLDEIGALPIADLCDPAGAHIYLWVTHKFLPLGFDLLVRWGARYECVMTWRKNVGITPFSWMYDTEHALFARFGDGLDITRKGLRLSMDEATTRHSAKPDVFYQRVCEASPSPRLEMFARTPREGFVTWGNEAFDAA